MKTLIEIFPDTDSLTNYFVSRIAEGISQKAPGQVFSVALSGGSTPKAIFEWITKKYKDKIDWSRMVFFWGDERCVPPSDGESNFRMAYENLFRHLHLPDLHFCRIHGENDPESEAARYSEKVNIMLPNSRGIPEFDLMILGLGEDGHTASIFPYNIHLFSSGNLFVTSSHPATGQVRITATGQLINSSREVCFLVTGSGKAGMAARILRQQEGWDKLPASLVNPADGQVIWLLDTEAASLL